MSEPISYESLWPFWLDDACYRIERGARLLDIPSDVTRKTWDEKIEPSLHYQTVLVRYVGDDEGGEIQVTKHKWVFGLLDHAARQDAKVCDAITGVLLGYSGEAIADYLANKDETPCP